MLRFFSLSSGSCGNCYYLGTEDNGILIDAGVSLKQLKKIFQSNGIDIDTVRGVLVTHDHLDHIRFLGTFCKRLYKPVYTTEAIYNALLKHSFTSSVISSCCHTLPADGAVELPGISFKCFEVPHDATQTVGYSINIDNCNFVIMTDIGRMTDEAVGYASQADTLVIESNYDMDMLMSGTYPYELKMRIIQGCGHLSNDECASALKRAVHPGLKNIFLCHLSENNNTPERAFSASSAALEEVGVEKGTIHLRCLPRTYPSPVFYL